MYVNTSSQEIKYNPSVIMRKKSDTWLALLKAVTGKTRKDQEAVKDKRRLGNIKTQGSAVAQIGSGKSKRVLIETLMNSNKRLICKVLMSDSQLGHLYYGISRELLGEGKNQAETR